MRFLRIPLWLSLLLLFAASVQTARAQDDPAFENGLKPFGSYHAGNIDHIDLSNVALNVDIPLISYPQRGGKLKLDFVLHYHNSGNYYDCAGYDPNGNCDAISGEPYLDSGWNVMESGAPLTSLNCGDIIDGQYDFDCSGVVYTPDGGAHQILPEPNMTTWQTFDASGFQMNLSSPPTFHVDTWQPGVTTDANGIRYSGGAAAGLLSFDYFNNGFGPNYYSTESASYLPASREDTNGNTITLSSQGWTDTMGRVIPMPQKTSDYTGCAGPLPTSAAVLWTPPGVPATNGNTGNSAATYPIKFCFAQVTETYSFGQPNPYSNEPADYTYTQPFTQLQSVIFANSSGSFSSGTTVWIFQYTSDGNMDLSQITFPAGGTLSYTWNHQVWGVECQQGYPCPGHYYVFVPQVATRTLNPNDGITPSAKWTYVNTAANCGGIYSCGTFTTTVTDPAANDTVHTFSDHSSSGNIPDLQFYETEGQFYQGSHSSGTLLKTANTAYQYNTMELFNSATITDEVLPAQKTVLWANRQENEVTYAYDTRLTLYDSEFSCSGNPNCPSSGFYPGYHFSMSYGLLLSQKEYDYGNGSPGPLLRTTTTSYQALNNSAYLNNNLLDLTYSVQIADGGGTQRTYTYYGYDESSRVSSGITTSRDTAPPASPYFGNQTSVHRWISDSTVATTNCNVSVSNGYLVTTNVFYDTGTLNKTTDPCGYATSFQYSSSYAGALLTATTNALGQTMSHQYDFNTGLLTSTTDPNNQTTTNTYDWMFRLTETTNPDGGTTTYSYPDPNDVTIMEAIDSAGNKRTSHLQVDGLGREVRTDTTNGEATPYDQGDTCYDGLGRVAFKTYAYQAAGISSTTRACPSTGTQTGQTGDWTTYDALSRVTALTHWDRSVATTSYTGGCTTVTDEAGHTRESCTDGVGRLTQVIENPGSLNYTTTYTYDALDDLTSTVQTGSRQRTFTHDSLSRRLSAADPESGTISYAYDADGNVVTKTTGTGTLFWCYDKLNRMTAKAYSVQTCNANGTVPSPVATYWYDGNSPSNCSVGSFSYGSYAKMHRTAMCDQGGSEAWSYDSMGRVATHQRTTNGITKTASGVYNFLDDPTSITYPSGRTITYGYNVGGRPISAVDNANSITYANSVHYGAGGLCSAVLGSAITITSTFNARLQPLEIQATTSGAPSTPCAAPSQTGTLLDLTYNLNYGSGDNGNAASVTNNRDSTRSQSFTYDALNRLQTAQTSGTHATSPAHCWGESYLYDNQTTAGTGAWGNLTSIGVSNTAYNGCTQESFSQSVTTSNQISGFGYDAAGNLTSIPAGGMFTYDPENHLISTAGVNYTYDGDGERVEKSNGEIYWYTSGGEVLDETNLSGTLTSEYIFFAGVRIARRDASGNVFYYLADHLDSSRVIVQAGQSTPCYDADFYPFGGERAYTNTCPQNYKFTGKERDPESNLDNFEARYYGSSVGRFMSADDPFVGWQLNNPQSLNLYAYVQDNPINDVDPTGHCYYGADAANGNRSGWSPSCAIADIGDPANVIDNGLANVNLGAIITGQQSTSNMQNLVLGEQKYLSNVEDAVAQARQLKAKGKDLTAQVPGQAKNAIMNSVTASNSPNATDKTGGFHEESGVAGTDKSGNLVISPDLPGPTVIPGPDVTKAESGGGAVNQELQDSIANPIVEWHVHPSGVANGYGFIQEPSPHDTDTAHPWINIVVGARDKQVYFYGTSGIIGQTSLKEFMKGANP